MKIEQLKTYYLQLNREHDSNIFTIAESISFSDLENDIKTTLSYIQSKNKEQLIVKGEELSLLKILNKIYSVKLNFLPIDLSEQEFKNKLYFYFDFSLFLSRYVEGLDIIFRRFLIYHWKLISKEERFIIENILKVSNKINNTTLNLTGYSKDITDSLLCKHIVNFDFNESHSNNFLFGFIKTIIEKHLEEQDKIVANFENLSVFSNKLPFDLMNFLQKNFEYSTSIKLLEKFFSSFSTEAFYELLTEKIKDYNTPLQKEDLYQLNQLLKHFVNFKREDLNEISNIQSLVSFLKALFLLIFRVNKNYRKQAQFLEDLRRCFFYDHFPTISEYNNRITPIKIFSIVLEDTEVSNLFFNILKVKEIEKNNPPELITLKSVIFDLFVDFNQSLLMKKILNGNIELLFSKAFLTGSFTAINNDIEKYLHKTSLNELLNQNVLLFILANQQFKLTKEFFSIIYEKISLSLSDKDIIKKILLDLVNSRTINNPFDYSCRNYDLSVIILEKFYSEFSNEYLILLIKELSQDNANFKKLLQKVFEDMETVSQNSLFNYKNSLLFNESFNQ